MSKYSLAASLMGRRVHWCFTIIFPEFAAEEKRVDRSEVRCPETRNLAAGPWRRQWPKQQSRVAGTHRALRYQDVQAIMGLPEDRFRSLANDAIAASLAWNP
jgi:hypothetical protein